LRQLSPRCVRRERGRAASDWRRAVAAVSERRVAQGRALYTKRSPAEVYRGARSSERERYARQASRLGAERPSPAPASEIGTLATPYHWTSSWEIAAWLESGISARVSPRGKGVRGLGRLLAAQPPGLRHRYRSDDPWCRVPLSPGYHGHSVAAIPSISARKVPRSLTWPSIKSPSSTNRRATFPNPKRGTS